MFFPFSIKTNKRNGSCNNINHPYAKICVPDVVKNLNVNFKTNVSVNLGLIFVITKTLE